MGLDATVYCNCFETGNLKEIPPFFDKILVTSDGSLDCKSDDMETLLEFDQWVYRRACNHENGVKIIIVLEMLRLFHFYIVNSCVMKILFL